MAIFAPKPFAEITAGMIEQVRASTDRLTDFNVGSVVRSLLEANAVELDDYYQAVYLGLTRAIPTAIYTGFGFDLRPAVAARGTLLFTRSGSTAEALTIPAGTTAISASGQTYATLAAATMAIGATTVTAEVTADTAGAAGNSDPNTLALANLNGTLTATNPAVVTGGLDAETDEQRASRFAAYVKALSRGTLAALEYGATEPVLYHPVTGVPIERVQRAAAHETPGHIDLYIHNGSTGASADLIAAVQQWIDGVRDEDTGLWVGGYRPAGARCDVVALTETAFDLAIEVQHRASADLTVLASTVRGALELAIRAALPGDLLRPADLIAAILACDGVLGGTVLEPTTATTVPADAILYLDTLVLTWRA